MKNGKRWWPALLLALALSVLPAAPAQAADGPADRLPEAVNGVITLTGDVTLTETWQVTEDTVLDLNGHCLRVAPQPTQTGTESFLYGVRVETGDVTLTIRDTSGEDGSLIVTNAAPEEASGSLNCNVVTVSLQDGGITVDSGRVEAVTVRTDRDAYAIRASGDFDVTVNGGEVLALQDLPGGEGKARRGPRAIYAGSSAENANASGAIDIFGGTVRTSTNSSAYQSSDSPYSVAVWADNGRNGQVDISISGGTVKAEGIGSPALAVWSTGEKNTCLITGGEISAISTGTYAKTLYFEGGTDNVITGGRITAAGDSIAAIHDSLSVRSEYRGVSGKTVEAAVYGGSFNGRVYTQGDVLDCEANLILKGGQFTQPVQGEYTGIEKYVPGHYQAVALGPESAPFQSRVLPVPLPEGEGEAAVTTPQGKTTVYPSLQDALYCTGDGDTVKPLVSFGENLLTRPLNAVSDCTLDLDGKTLGFAGNVTCGVRALAGADLTIDDTGTSGCIRLNSKTENTTLHGLFSRKNGTLTLKGGSILVEAQGAGSSAQCMTALRNGVINAEDGTLHAAASGNDGRAVCLTVGSSGTVTMNGGTACAAATGNEGTAYGLFGNSRVDLAVNGGKVEALALDTAPNAYAVHTGTGGEIKITDGELIARAQGENAMAFAAEGMGGVAVTGGVLTASSEKDGGVVCGIFGGEKVICADANVNAAMEGGGGIVYGIHSLDDLTVTDTRLDARSGGSDAVVFGLNARCEAPEADETLYAVHVADSTIRAAVSSEGTGSAVGVCAGSSPWLGSPLGQYDVTIDGTSRITAESAGGNPKLADAVFGVIASRGVTLGKEVTVEAGSKGDVYLTAGMAGTNLELTGGVVDAEKADTDSGFVFALMSSGTDAADAITVSDGVFLATGGEDRNVIFDSGEGEPNTTVTGGWFTNSPAAIYVLDGDRVEEIRQQRESVLNTARQAVLDAQSALTEAREDPAASQETLEALEQTYREALSDYFDAALSTLKAILVFREADAVAEGLTVSRSSPNRDYPEYAQAHYHVTEKSSGGGGGGVRVYAVTAEPARNGTVTADRTQASAGTRVTVTAVPAEGYALEAITVRDGEGSEVALTRKDETACTFLMPGSAVTVTGTFRQVAPAPDDLDPVDTCRRTAPFCPLTRFTDLEPAAWYHDGVHYALAEKLMQGMSETRFAPGEATTRAMIVTMLWRQEGEPQAAPASFTDVGAGSWYEAAVNWAAAYGIVKGYTDTAFGPDDPVTREQMTAILCRYAQYQGADVSAGEDTNLLSYDDISDLSQWAYPTMQWAVGAGLIQGKGSESTLAPLDETTRAEVATLFLRMARSVPA